MTDTCVCECCGQRLPGPLTVAELRAWCRERGHAVLPGDLVRTEVAARILDLAPQTLRADRVTRARVPFVKVGRRCLYRLADLVFVDLR